MKKAIIAILDILLGWNRPMVLVLVIVLVALSLSGCTSANSVSDWRGSRYYYDYEACPWGDGFMGVVEQAVAFNVLPYKQFRKAAWAHHFDKSTKAFSEGWAIWLQIGYTLDSLYHEIAHIHDYINGREGHNEQCWNTYKPWGYDDTVINALGEFRPI